MSLAFIDCSGVSGGSGVPDLHHNSSFFAISFWITVTTDCSIRVNVIQKQEIFNEAHSPSQELHFNILAF